MADINIAGVMRAGAYSPNHIGNDTAIFNAVAEQLRKRGCIVNTYSEEQFNKSDIREDIIVNMCREHSSIMKLQKLENQGQNQKNDFILPFHVYHQVFLSYKSTSKINGT